MRLVAFARWHPFLFLCGFTLLIMSVGRFVPLNYDDGGIGAVWFALSYGLTTVFRYTSIAAALILGRQDGLLHTILALGVGIGVYGLLDLLLLRYATRRAAIVQ